MELTLELDSKHFLDILLFKRQKKNKEKEANTEAAYSRPSFKALCSVNQDFQIRSILEILLKNLVAN